MNYNKQIEEINKQMTKIKTLIKLYEETLNEVSNHMNTSEYFFHSQTKRSQLDRYRLILKSEMKELKDMLYLKEGHFFHDNIKESDNGAK